MRHDDSSKRPRVDPAQNPRLAAALGRLSQGIRDAIDEAPSAQPAAAGELIRSAPDDEVYVPNNDEIELLDNDNNTDAEAAQPAEPFDPATEGGFHRFDEEMVPTSSELMEALGGAPEALPPPSLDGPPIPSFRQGVIAYGGPLPAEEPLLASGDEVLEPSDSELELFDAAPPAAPEPADFEGTPLAETALDATPLDTPAEPSDEPDADAPAEPPGGSPWAVAAAEKAIDVRALPSSLAPIIPAVEAEKAKPAAAPEVGSPGKSGRSWLTIFLALALVASIVTFLLLKFNVVDGPEGRPSADTTPIQVPTSAPAATQAPVVPVVSPPEPASAAAPEPSVAEPLVAEPSPTGEDPAAASGTAPAASGSPVLGTGQAPTGVKPSGPSQSGKKPSRIF